jgi:hypothetical protein
MISLWILFIVYINISLILIFEAPFALATLLQVCSFFYLFLFKKSFFLHKMNCGHYWVIWLGFENCCQLKNLMLVVLLLTSLRDFCNARELCAKLDNFTTARIVIGLQPIWGLNQSGNEFEFNYEWNFTWVSYFKYW